MVIKNRTQMTTMKTKALQVMTMIGKMKIKRTNITGEKFRKVNGNSNRSFTQQIHESLMYQKEEVSLSTLL